MGIDRQKKCMAMILLGLLIACTLIPALCLARDEARMELRTGDVVLGLDYYRSRSQQCLFHQQAANLSDSEILDIDFPAFTDTLAPVVLGPAEAGGGGVAADGLNLGAGSGANVLPFGPVNLAFPSIRQTVDQTYTASDTGFYQANFLGITTPNYGASPVLSGPDAFASPVTPPSAIAGPTSPYPEMYNIIPGYERQKAIIKRTASGPSQNATGKGASIRNTTLFDQSIVDLPANDTVVRAQQSGSGTVSQTISGQEIIGAETAVPRNYTGLDTSAANMSYTYFPFNSRAGRISNMSMLDRMWRNAHLGTMGRAYEGDTSAPIWILPTEYTKSAISMYNWNQVNNDALNYTAPGTHLLPRFWGLGIADSLNPAYDIVPDMMDKVPGISGPNNTTAAGNKSISPSMNVTLRNLTYAGTPKENNTTGQGNATAGPQAPASSDIPTPYMPAGGPAGTGPGWDFAGPKQKAWLGGALNPWVTGPSNNVLFAGRGGPDWPPFYWGFGRYKGY